MQLNVTNLYVSNLFATNITVNTNITITTNITINEIAVTTFADLLWTNIANVLQPLAGTSVEVTNLISYQLLTADGGFRLYGLLSSNLVAGANDLNPYQVGVLQLTGPTATPTDTTISLSGGNGSGQLIVIENYTDGVGFCLTNNTPQWDDPSFEIRLSNGDWCPMLGGESMLLRSDSRGDWVEVARQLSQTNVFNEIIVTNVTVKGNIKVENYITINGTNVPTINPTDGYLPYRINTNTFGDSPWYRIDDNTLGLSSTTRFLYGSSGGNAVALGLLSGIGATHSFNAGYTAGRDATGQGIVNIGSGAGQQSDGNFHVFIGNSAGKFAEGEGNVGIGLESLIRNTNGLYNVAVGSYSGDNEQGSYNTFIGTEAFGGASVVTNDYNVAIGYRAGYTSANLTNTIAIGQNVSATNDNEIVIGRSDNTKAIFPITSYTGVGDLFLSDDGTYKAAGTTINPTDTYIPYRTSATVFGDSPFNVIATNVLGFYGTDQFLWVPSSTTFTLGWKAGDDKFVGANAVAIGSQSMRDADGEFQSVAIGSLTLLNGNGSDNVAIGHRAMQGGALSLANNSVAVGFDALFSIEDGYNNVGVGAETLYAATDGYRNTAVGYQAGKALTTGWANILIGDRADLATATITNSIVLGVNSKATNDNEIIIGSAIPNMVYFPGSQIRVHGNVWALLSAGGSGAEAVIDMQAASRTNSVSAAITYAHATNGVDGWEATHVETYYNGSGSDYLVTLNSDWINPDGASFTVTNAGIVKLYVNSMGDTSSAALQTNVMTQIKFMK